MSKLRIKNLIYNNEKGYTLAIVLMVMLVFSILGMSVMAMSMNSVKMSDSEREDQSVFYVAESGASIKMVEIEKLVQTLSKNSPISSKEEFFNKLEVAIISKVNPSTNKRIPSIINSFETNKSEQPIANVTVQLDEIMKNTTSRKYKIISMGKIGEKARTVELNFIVDYQQGSSIKIPENVALYSKGIVKLSSNATIHGKVMTASGEKETIQLSSNAKITDMIYIPNSSYGELEVIDDKSKTIKKDKVIRYSEKHEFPLPSFPEEFPKNYKKIKDIKTNVKDAVDINNNISIKNRLEINLDDNYEFNNIDLSNNSELTFIVNEPRSVVINNISMSSNSKFYIKGNGILTIYLKNTIDLSSNSDFNPGGTENVFMYIGASQNPKDPKTLKNSSNSELNASIYAKDANIDLSSNTSVKGHIITGGKVVKISSNGSARATGAVVYAPFAFVDMSSNSAFYGSVISGSLEMSSNAEIYGTNINLNDVPFFNNGNNTSTQANTTKLTTKETVE